MPELRRKSVVLLSGGLDSAACLAFCHLSDEPILALTCRYGQRAEVKEVEAASRLASQFGVRHEVVDLGWLGKLGGNALTNIEKPVPGLKSELLDDPEATRRSAQAVWVPNRNGVLISVAASFAERLGASQVVLGFNREEAATFPDNTIEFMNRSNRALELSTATGVRVHSYTAEWDKRETVSNLRALVPEFPFGFVWSCYLGGERPCGECESCRRLERALA